MSRSIPKHSSVQCLLFVLVLVGSAGAAADETFAVPASVANVLSQHCVDCHSGDAAEGDVRLEAITQLDVTERLELLNRAQEQLFLGQMPPEDAAQPTAVERVRLAGWLSQELRKFKASKLEQKLQRPEFGNYVDHDQLFSG